MYPSPSEKIDRRTVRTSVSISAECHQRLERIAHKKKVSLAWVVRDAIEKYLESEKSLSEP
ncbi:MAG: ribbon-helix-helix protein, CopG family [Pirellulales bacterium]|nr:ribbon-helix-helix protein, CopG family [Pirellulales bacterium]